MKNILFLFLVITFLSGCKNIIEKDRVNYDHFGSYMEYTIEDDVLIVRGISGIGSYRFISKYKINKDENDNIYYLSFYFNSKQDEKCMPEIEFKKWGGIQLRLNISKIPLGNKLYYKDTNGKYEIINGSKETWRKYLLSRMNKEFLNNAKSLERLKDI